MRSRNILEIQHRPFNMMILVNDGEWPEIPFTVDPESDKSRLFRNAVDVYEFICLFLGI